MLSLSLMSRITKGKRYYLGGFGSSKSRDNNIIVWLREFRMFVLIACQNRTFDYVLREILSYHCYPVCSRELAQYNYSKPFIVYELCKTNIFGKRIT